MGIDCLHRVKVLQVPGQVVLGGEGRRPQLVGICCGGGGIGTGIVGVDVVMVVQGQSVVGEGIGIRLTIAVAAAAMTTTCVLLAAVVVVWCRHGVPRARQHSGRAFSGGAWALERSLQGLLKHKEELT